MDSPRHTRSRVRTVLTALCVSGVTAAALAQAPAAPVRYRATAMNVDPSVNLTATTVHITVDRWSTDAERNQLLETASGDQNKLLKVLQNMPKAGTISTPDSITYELRYAKQTPGEKGGAEIMLITDRFISFFEAANRPRTADYPFMVVQLQLNANGEGEGTITVASKISGSAQSRHVIVENLGSQPVRLTKVSRVD